MTATATATVWPTFSWRSGKALLAGAVSIAQIILPTTAMGLQTGTGGSLTADYYRDRGAKGYPLAQYDAVSIGQGLAAVPTATDNLARIRAVLKPTVAELARTLNVSRQAIYDWQSGAPIAEENAAKLADLARAADLFASEGLTITHQTLTRLIGGQSFLDSVREGESAEVAARTLLGVLRRELQQRQMLSDRLKGRVAPANLVEDLGVPHLSERG